MCARARVRACICVYFMLLRCMRLILAVFRLCVDGISPVNVYSVTSVATCSRVKKKKKKATENILVDNGADGYCPSVGFKAT